MVRPSAILVGLLSPAVAAAAPVLGTLGTGAVEDLCVGPGDTLCGIVSTGALVCRDPTDREWTSRAPSGHRPHRISCLRDGGVAVLGWEGSVRVVDVWRADLSWREIGRFADPVTASDVGATGDGGFVITGWRGPASTSVPFVDHYTADGTPAVHARPGTDYPRASASFLGAHGPDPLVLTAERIDTWTAVSVAPDGGTNALLSTQPDPDHAPFGHPFFPEWAAVDGRTLVLGGTRPSAWGGVQAAIAEVVWVRDGSVGGDDDASIVRVVGLSDGRVVALLATEGAATLDGRSLGSFAGTRLWTFAP